MMCSDIENGVKKMINHLSILKLYFERITKWENEISVFNLNKTGVRDKYNNLMKISQEHINIDEIIDKIKTDYYEKYYSILKEKSVIQFLENGESLSCLYHLFSYSKINFPLEFLEKSLKEIDEFGDWVHSQKTIETDCWIVTHEVYRQLNLISVAIRNLIKDKK